MSRDARLIWILVLAVVIVTIVMVLIGLALGPTHPMDWMDGSMDTSWLWLMILVGVGVPIVTILVAVAMITYIDSSRGVTHVPATDRGADRETALNIIAERYARGEISREEYLEMVDDIRNG